MKQQIGRNITSLTAVVSIIALTFGLIAGCGKKKPAPTDANNVTTTTGARTTDALDQALGGGTTGGGEIPGSLQKLVRETKDWSPAFEPYWGKFVQSFTANDINGNVHEISKYRGKNTVVMFWRTNNPTCKMAAAALKELRGAIPEGSLAILSVSNEPPAALKDAATAQGINFVVLSGGNDLQPPFSSVDTLPTTFFIDQKGRLKLAVMGVVSVTDAKAIIEAK
jgi:peroxiredoxin